MQEAALRSRLGVPIFFAYDVVHGHRTIFPIGLGLASSWNLPTIARSGRVAAIEASADGLDMTFAPTVDISRDPRWGRTSEGFGEDPYLVSEIARTMVKAYQGESVAAPDSIMASVKHFALYGAVEGGRDYNVVDMSPMRMHQDFLPPYRAAVEAGAGGVMVALNAINGVPASANSWLLRDLLRRDWGFRGMTVSDHGAISELLRHGVAQDGREAARLALKAGINMSMADSLYRDELPGLVRDGEIEIGEIDAAVREVLGAKYDMGLFHDPLRRIGAAADDPQDVNAESRLHRAEARAVARESLVLLENRAKTLPLKKSGTIALVGPLADSPLDMLGSWSAAGVAAQAVTLRQGLTAALAGKATLLHARGANITDDPHLVEYLNFLNWDTPEVVQDPRPAAQMIAEAVAAAERADVVIAAVGESRGMSHESSSRTSLQIPPSQQALLRALNGNRQAAGAGADERPAAGAWLGQGQCRCDPGNLVQRHRRRSRHRRCAARRLQPFRQAADLLSALGGADSHLLQSPARRASLRRGQTGQLHLAVLRGTHRPAVPVRLRPELYRFRAVARVAVECRAAPAWHLAGEREGEEQRFA